MMRHSAISESIANFVKFLRLDSRLRSSFQYLRSVECLELREQHRVTTTGSTSSTESLSVMADMPLS